MSEIKKNEGKLLGITDELLATASTAQAKKRFGEPPIIKKRILKPTDKYKHILSPLKLNDKFTMKNRVMCAPMVFGAAVVGNEYGNAAYAPGKYSKVEMPAAGGTAMVSVGEIDINSREAKRMPLPDVDFTIRSGEAFNAISEYAWRIKRHGAIALHELCHCGQMKPAIPGTEIWGPVAGHTPDGGTITVTAEETALFMQITVEDTGPGFSEKDIPHLFERFYKGSNASESSYGIGLALARTVISAQNGTVQAMNGSNGAKFVIKFYKQVI